MMGIPTKDWDEIPSTGLMFCQTSSQEVLQTEPITYRLKYIFLRNKRNTNRMSVGDNILADSAGSCTDENWCLIDNQST